MRRRRATVQWRHLVNWREAARCGEWALHFSNASCYKKLCSVVDVAVEGAHNSIMFNMGQVCCAGSRTYVHESIYDEFIKRSIQRAKKRTTGDPFMKENENGPQVAIYY